jgi:hypothetical protein
VKCIDALGLAVSTFHLGREQYVPLCLPMVGYSFAQHLDSVAATCARYSACHGDDLWSSTAVVYCQSQSRGCYTQHGHRPCDQVHGFRFIRVVSCLWARSGMLGVAIYSYHTPGWLTHTPPAAAAAAANFSFLFLCFFSSASFFFLVLLWKHVFLYLCSQSALCLKVCQRIIT